MSANMNADASENNERVSVVQKLDDVNGIGRPTAEALYAIGIRSYADLIEYLNQHTDRQIGDELKKHGANLRPGFKKEEWIKSARELSQREKSLSPHSGAEPGAAKGTAKQPSRNPLVEHDDEYLVFFDSLKDADGKPFLRTTVYHEKNAGREEIFDGGETAEWANWMIEHANLSFPVEPIAEQGKSTGEPPATRAEDAAPSTPPLTPAKPLDARLDISGVQMILVEPWEKIPIKRLKAEVRFQLSGGDAGAMLSEGIPFRTEIYKIDLDNGAPEQVASRDGQLVPGRSEYIDELEFAIPEVGRYDYYSLVRLLPYGDLMAYYLGPTMRVNP